MGFKDRHFETVLGYRIPKGTLPCWLISEEERLDSLKNKKPFRDYKPSCYFKINKRLDNNFIEGHLGHSSREGEFHESIATTYTYFDEYQRRVPVYFSFDRVTLYRLVEVIPSQPLSFILKRIDSPQTFKKNQAFMIMPFMDEELNALYKTHIKPFLKKEMGIDILRADDFDGNDIIIDTIYKQIEEAEFIIADTSHPNKNVFYEFGYASAKEKEIITIQNTDIDQSLFFDRVHIRAVLYSLSNISAFKKQLKNTVVAIREKVSAQN